MYTKPKLQMMAKPIYAKARAGLQPSLRQQELDSSNHHLVALQCNRSFHATSCLTSNTLQKIVLNCISTMSCTPMQSIFPCYITLLCVALYYITHPSMLHYASLHYIALNCISPMSCNPMQLILPCYITLLYINLYQITFLQ